MTDKPVPLIVIVGPTATGKSDLAISIAKHFSGEIISADSWMVRRGVDIGSAKPSKAQLERVPHHMIDILNPDEDFSAAEFKKLAVPFIEEIYGRGKLPILAGGTGLYIDSVIYDYSFLPSSDPKQRAFLYSLALDRLIDIAEAENLPLERIDQRNKRRVIRLIETKGAFPSKNELRQNTLVLGTAIGRDELKEVISHRTAHMIKAGLGDEVSRLAKGYGWDCEALKGIGYHEWRLYFDGNQDLKTTMERINKDTYNLAKRQQTWFKQNKSIQWITTPVKQADVVDIISSFLNK